MFVSALAALAVVQLFAVFFSLYWVYHWLDIPMHIFGGLVVALGYLAFVERFELPRTASGLNATLLATLVVGLGWEAYELVTGAFFRDVAPLGDTMLDLLMDLVGAALGYAIAVRVGAQES